MEVRQSAVFRKWFSDLRDLRAKARISVLIDRLELGLMGDAKFFDGIGEIRIDYGPGYRLYFVQRGDRLIILLCGGDKSSQKRDIALARQMAKD